MSLPPSASEYSFGDFRLRPSERSLTERGEVVRLGARAFDLLLALVEHRERVVGKNELLEIVWPSVIVEENNLQVHISALRKLLGPAGIATIPGRGYRFVLSVDEDAALNASSGRTGPVVVPGSIQAGATNLPHNLPPLFGRETELPQVRQLVEQHSLVAVVGAGGIGKTRLAQAVAHAMRDQYADGVWMVELAPVADPALALSTVAQVLGISLGGTEPAQKLLVDALQHQKLLLVLDNCEHLLDGVAAFVEAVLRSAPGVSILVTSQEPLRLGQEHQFRLGTLSVPGPTDDRLAADVSTHGAVALFVDRARAIDPRFALTDETAPAVADICRRLDGIALAIELAAARVSLLGLTGLRDKLGERFRVLTAGARLSPRRHQTLHAALDWSFGLLSQAEQAVFRRLGVFCGGFTLDAAQDVAVDDTGIDAWVVLDHLGALVDKSLVVADPGDVPRYGLLETTRAYALEQLAQAGETAATVRRHALAVKTLFERAEEERFGEKGTLDEASFCRRLQPELDNLSAALAWSRADGGDPAIGVALAAASAEAKMAIGLGAEALRQHLALQRFVGPATDEDVAARFWNALARLGAAGRIEREAFLAACDGAERLFRRSGQHRRLYGVLANKARTFVLASRFPQATEALLECDRLEDASWPGWVRFQAPAVQAVLHNREHRFDRALAIYREMAGMLPSVGEERSRYRVLFSQCYVTCCMGQFAQAVPLTSAAIEEARAQRMDSQILGYAFSTLIGALAALGRVEEAHDALEEAVRHWQRDGSVMIFCDHPSLLCAKQGRHADAARLAGVADGFNERGGISRQPNEVRARADVQRLLEEAPLPGDQLQRWMLEGRSLDVDRVVALLLGREATAPT